MQLKRLYIKDYKILKDFTIEFPYDFKKYISVFIGANGSGKSTILEAVAEILSCVFLSKQSKFDFEIEYSIKSDDILSKFSISNPKLKQLPIKITGDSGYLPRTEIDFSLIPQEILEYGDNSNLIFAQRNSRNLMPDNIVIYYSGLSDIMKELCKPHEDRLSEAYRKGNANIDRGFFYYKPEHFGIILLSLLSFEYGDIPKYLDEKAKISGLQKVIIQLQKPEWAKDTIGKFWGAEGEVRKFLDYLKEKSQKNKNIDIKNKGEETLAINFNGLKTLYEIREYLIEERKLFEMLNIMLADGLLKEISFSLIKKENGKKENISILSEGEQQAITIKGLTEFLSGKNTLFLFDEPDTYLHPEWQRKFIPEIQTAVDNTLNSENYYLVATHSPNIVSGVERDSLFVMEHGEVKEIPFNSFGKNVESLLIDFFNVEGVRNKYVESLLTEVQEMVKNKQFDSPEFKAKFKELKNILRPTSPEIVNINLEIAKSR